jgi:ABC-2 type transport system permease protein
MVALLLPGMFLLAIAMGSFGVLLATRIRTIEAFQAIMPMLTFPMIFLSGVFFSVEDVPNWMSVLSKINPATYGITVIRQIALGGISEATFELSLFGRSLSLWNNVGILAAFGALMILLAMRSFGSQE